MKCQGTSAMMAGRPRKAAKMQSLRAVFAWSLAARHGPVNMDGHKKEQKRHRSEIDPGAAPSEMRRSGDGRRAQRSHQRGRGIAEEE